MQYTDLRSILDSINDAIFIHGLDGRIIDVNNKMLEMYGVSREQAINSRVEKDFSSSENYFERLSEQWAKVLQGGSYTFEWKARRPNDGLEFDVEVSLHKISLATGDAILATIHDISSCKENERALKYAQHISHVGSWDVDHNGITHWSDEFYRILGLQPQSEVPSFKLLKSFIHPADKERVLKTINSYRDGKSVYAIEYRIITKDGKILHVRSEGQAILDGSGLPVRWYGILQDITEQIIAENVLRDSEEMFRAMFEQAAVGIASRDLNGNYTKVNKKMIDMLGYSQEEFKMINFREITPREDAAAEDALIKKLLSGEISHYSLDKRYIRKDGEHIWANVVIYLIHDKYGSPKYYIGILEDITEQKLLADKIKSSLKEKDVLLKEVNHRVKNHLQIINSLLSLQSGYIKDKDDLAIFKETQNSIRSMALIHEKIYATGNLSEINMTEYLQVLAIHLIKSFTTNNRVRMNFDMDPVYLPVEKAVPCGLIVNELVTNCMKYAFPDNRKGEITLLLRLNDKLTITVRDNGVGFPENIDYKNSDSLGMQIISSLTEQLEGTFELEKSAGTTFHIAIQV